VEKLDERDNIADAWIRLYHLPVESEERDRNFWAFMRLSDLVRTDPEAAWLVIQEILRKDTGDVILSNLGAGPLEDLLVAHGERVIDRIEERAARDSTFKKLLGVVWKNAMSEHVWKRIKTVAAPSW
jgi:hypothetical protein